MHNLMQPMKDHISQPTEVNALWQPVLDAVCCCLITCRLMLYLYDFPLLSNLLKIDTIQNIVVKYLWGTEGGRGHLVFDCGDWTEPTALEDLINATYH